MLRAIDRIKPYEIDVICPGHGPIHKENIRKAIDLSVAYSEEYMKLTWDRSHRNILIAYVSAYGYTKEAAEIIASGIPGNQNIVIETIDIENISAEELDAKLTWADGVLIGSPTINQNTFLPVYKLFAQINPMRDRGKLGGAFGSYGWSGESPRIILENLRQLKLNVFEESAAFKFSPGGSKTEELKEFGRKFGERFLEGCEQIKNPDN
jgi:flavorubredoxin